MAKKKSVKRKSMKKKRVKRKVVKRKPFRKKTIIQTTTEVKVERILVENFVSLQKVLVNLSVKMENLTTKISKLLEIFELSAKALAEKDFDFERGGKEDPHSKKILENIDKLLDQNKLLAKGLTLVHDRFPDQGYEPEMESPFPHPLPRVDSNMTPPAFRPMGQSPTGKKSEKPKAPKKPESPPGMEGFQRSIISDEPELNELPEE